MKMDDIFEERENDPLWRWHNKMEVESYDHNFERAEKQREKIIKYIKERHEFQSEHSAAFDYSEEWPTGFTKVYFDIFSSGTHGIIRLNPDGYKLVDRLELTRRVWIELRDARSYSTREIRLVTARMFLEMDLKPPTGTRLRKPNRAFMDELHKQCPFADMGDSKREINSTMYLAFKEGRLDEYYRLLDQIKDMKKAEVTV